MATAMHAPEHDQHHEMPTGGRALDRVALSATLHCLTGCAIGEVLGMIIGTALGFSDWATIGLAVALAFLFGYGLTSLPLLRAGLAVSAVIPIALASDTLSIAVMEVVDNGVMLIVPGAMDSGVGSVLFWGSLSFALVIAGLFAFPVNRWLISRGKGHAVVHETGIHGGPDTRIVAAIAALAFVFGSSVLAGEAVGGGSDEPSGGHGGPAETHGGAREPETHGGSEPGGSAHPANQVRGLAVASGGLTLELERTELPRARRDQLRFRIVGTGGRPVRDFDVEHEKRMHLIVVRRDMQGFQHLHPKLERDGTWSTPIRIPDAGAYRVFADFKRDDTNHTLAANLTVDGSVDWRALPAASTTSRTSSGYDVALEDHGGELRFTVSRDGRAVKTEPYLGAGGHLVALRQGDLAFLHTHPTGRGDGIAFETRFPTPGRYRLFLQFQHRGQVHTAPFTRVVSNTR